MSNLSPFDLSNAAWRCDRAATAHGWSLVKEETQFVSWQKGKRYLVLSLAVHGGVIWVGTDMGDYTGRDRAGWAVKYLERW